MVVLRLKASTKEFTKEERSKEVLDATNSLKADLRRIFLFVVNFLFNRPRVFSWIGIINRRIKFLNSVFVAYPASEEYAFAYVYPRHRDLMRWNPWPVGLFRQNGKWGMMFVISSTEKDFYENTANLKLLLERTENLRKVLNTQQKSFAGVLPGLFFLHRMKKDFPEAEVTVKAILRAEEKIRAQESCSLQTPIIVLGGRGFIGRRLMKNLHGREIYCVDISDDGDKWPSHLVGKTAILVNVTKRAVLMDYVDRIWPQLILLNEVYPEPDNEEICAWSKKGGGAYHLVGVKALSLPSFPKAYCGGIPCCAAWYDNDIAENFDVIVRKLN